VNSRIIRVDLDLEGNKLTVVQVYAPMEDTGIMEKEQFHSDLQRVADEARTDNRKLVVMGDLNGRTGQDKEQATVPWAVTEVKEQEIQMEKD
jgi:exonuclease III